MSDPSTLACRKPDKILKLAALIQSLDGDGGITKEQAHYGWLLAELARAHDCIAAAEKSGDRLKLTEAHATAARLYRACRSQADRNGLEHPNKVMAQLGYNRYAR